LNGGNGQTGSGSIQTASGSINLEAGNGIQLGSGTVSSSGGDVIWLAGGDIQLGDGSTIANGNNGSVTLEAGYDFVNQAVQPGSGNIYLNGSSGSIQLSQALINLMAGNSIIVGSGCQLIDDGGAIVLNAQTVDQNGLLQANSVGDQHGIIELVASDSLTLGANSKITANGDNSPAGSAGGNVTLLSANNFSDSVGSQITATGGAQGGNGGNIEISAPNVSSLPLNSIVDASAQAGSSAGQLFLGLMNLELGKTDGALPDNDGTINAINGFDTTYVNVNKAFLNITVGQILLEASGNISLDANTIWDLTASTGGNWTSGKLTLEAGGDIIFGGGSQIIDANSWSVTLNAGYSFANQAVLAGIGSIYLNGGSGTKAGSSIQTAAGDISLKAGRDILVNADQSPKSGFVRTTGGGSISAWALMGNVDAGTYAYGYKFSNTDPLNSTYCQIDPTYGVGGISTEAGGNVAITAGGDVTSYLPQGNLPAVIGGDAGSGAFGPLAGQVGDVTIVAGGNVTGHYVEANGKGAIFAGVKMDANGSPLKDAAGNYVLNSSSTGSAGTADNKLALSLVAGGWTVAAAQDIYLQEVRNPNGVFNTKTKNITPPSYHYFNYAQDAYVNLSAGNSVNLGDNLSNLPRDNSDGVDIPFIYAPILNIVAGRGGVVLGGDSSPYDRLILFPSPQGSLTITTTHGGSLLGSLPNNSDGTPSIFNLVVSDSALTQFPSDNPDAFGLSDHASTPVHGGGNFTPIVLDISGNMKEILLGAPEAAQITVGGDMINSRFQGMNLSSDSSQSVEVQVRKIDGSLGPATVKPGLTSINVTGDILNRGEFTTITLPDGAPAPDISKLAQAIDPSDVMLAANLAKEMFYEEITDPVTGTVTRQLTVRGALTDKVLNLLENLTYQVYDNGQPQFEPDSVNGGLKPKTETVNLLDPKTDPGTEGQIASALLAQYKNDSRVLGTIPTDVGSGYFLGGGGQFNVTAHNIDLGTTLGIVSQGVSSYTATVPDSDGNPVTIYPLTKYFTRGADINVTVSGNLDMFSTSISSVNGGNISIIAGGYVKAGSDVFSVPSTAARGIFTTVQSDISVIANGDINVNGSRIATFDGGDITVESLTGKVNAGKGASSTVTVDGFYVDPYVDPQTLARRVYHRAAQLPFSGIVALTFPQRNSDYPAPVARLGNILVEAPQGDVIANVAGILQVPLNYGNYPDASVTVLAGYELQDDLGNPLTAGDMAQGTPVLVSPGRNINAKGSGILASNAKLEASGSIDGLIFARNNIDINAQQNINVIALGQGNVNVSSSGGTISGTIIGVGGVNVSGSSVDASLISANVSGGTSGQSGLGQGTAANATAQAVSSDDSAKAAVADNQAEDDDKKKKKGLGAALMQKTGRVTVLLPPKDLSQNQTSNNHL
jgi:hypothetical protein